MKTKSLLAGIGVALLALGLVQQSAAQAAPGTFADANNPSGAPDPEKLDQIWQVDPINGQVSITIPFTTTPQGGRGPKIPFKLTYNSGSTVTLQGTDYSIVTGFTCVAGCSELSPMQGAALVWSPGQLYNPMPAGAGAPVGPWTTSGPYFSMFFDNIPDQVYTFTLPNGTTQPQDFGSGCMIGGPYLYTDEEGATHDENIEIVRLNSGVPNAIPPNWWPCQREYNSAQIVGMIPSATTDGSALETYQSSVIGPDGTSASGAWLSGGRLTDPNGNSAFLQTSSGVTTATDALGRTTFTTNIPVGQEGQIPAASYYVTTTGPTGAPESYTVQFSTQQIGTSGGGNPFTLPHPDPNNPNSEIESESDCLATVTCPQGYGIGEPNGGAQFPALSSVTMPDGTAYTFEYDSVYGKISKIIFPTGGYVRFAWTVRAQAIPYGQYLAISDVVITDVYTSTGNGVENHWYYTIDPYSPSAPLTSTVDSPDGSSTNYVGGCTIYSSVPRFYLGSRPSCKETSHATYSGGTLLASEARTFLQGLPVQIASSVYDGPTPLQRQTFNTYDNYLNIIVKQESDWSPCTPSSSGVCPIPSSTGPWLRQTYTIFSGDSNAPTTCNATTLASKYIVNKPCQIVVKDGSNKAYSLVNYSYDNYGNLLSESKCISGISIPSSSNSWTATCGSSWQTTYTYDATGQMLTKTEGANVPSEAATTQYTWTGPAGQTDSYNGYLTKITHPDLTTEKFTYWAPIGAIKTHTDVNNQTTTYSYADSLNRITSVVLPATTDGTTGSSAQGATTYTYTDAAEAFSVQEKHLMTGSTWTSVTKQYDGLGRAVTTLASSPQCTIETDTVYDSMSRVYSVSNPYCSSSDPTYGLTYFAYDGLGRKIQTKLPDGSVSKITYAGNATETTDPFNGTTNVQHIQQSDGLGRLTNVCEVGLSSQTGSAAGACGPYISGFGTPVTYPPNIPANGSLTTYIYDPLGNMLSVNQHGLGRSFTYDSLSRLTSALNPEVGLDTYTYSNSSNACSPSAGVPCTRTDARGVMTSYAYDIMSRLKSKSYSAASGNTTGGVSDLTSCYKYGSSQGTIGRLIAEWMQSGICSSSAPSTAVGVRYHSSYDAMGRVLADQQCLTGASCSTTTGNFIYTYNLLGNPVQSNNGIAPPSTVTATQTVNPNGNGTPITAPSITWKTTYDIADHILQVGVQDQPSYATGTTPAPVFPSTTYSIAPTLLKATNYDPFGHMTGAQLGIPNGSSTAAIDILRQYDKRGRITSEIDSGENAASSATGSLGIITISGSEQSLLTGTLTVTGSEQSKTVSLTGNNCPGGILIPNSGAPPTTGTCYDVGGGEVILLQISTSGATAGQILSQQQFPFSFSGPVTSASIVAETIASNLTGSGVTGVAATANGATVSVGMKGALSSSYVYVLAGGIGCSAAFSPCSFSFSTSGQLTQQFDAGSITATINSTPYTYSWGNGSTSISIANGLAAMINSQTGSMVTATQDAVDLGSIDLLSKGTGAATDYAVTFSIYDPQASAYPSLLPTASFLSDTGTMSGGAAADSSYGTIYSYLVPGGGYAPNGNILAHSDSVMGDWFFGYDSQDRLTAAAQFASTPTSTQFAGVNGSWSYDSYGNRTAQAFSNGANSNWATYNPTNNRISTAKSAVAGYVYDASGNTLNDGNNEYWYDAEGQLCAVQSLAVTGLPITQYIYDAEGARIAKGTLAAAPPNSTSLCAPPLGSGFTLTARYLVDQGGDQVTEMSEQSGEVWKHSNVFSAARLTATYDTNGLHYALADPLGTKRVQANTTGIVEEWYVSLPYGDALTPIPNPACTAANYCYAEDATEHHFTGKERDTESNNDYFFARYYNSALGRFTTPDWSAKVAPIPYAKMDDPQSLNLYSYVMNNPMDRIDADGHWTCTGANANGSACQAMTAIHAAEGLVANGVDGLALLAADREAMTQGPKDHYVTIMDYTESADGFHHVGIGVGKTDQTNGYSPVDPDTPKWERIIGAPKGTMENDIRRHTDPITGKVAPHEPHYIPITAAQANAIVAAIQAAQTSGGRYNLIVHNCAEKIESILHGAGVKGIPHGDIFPTRLIRAVDRISQ